MRYPKSIKTGDTIGVIAPSFGASSSPFKDRLDRSVENFEKAGYRVKLGPNAFLGEGLGKSNTPEKCAAEIMKPLAFVFGTRNAIKAELLRVMKYFPPALMPSRSERSS